VAGHRLPFQKSTDSRPSPKSGQSSIGSAQITALHAVGSGEGVAKEANARKPGYDKGAAHEAIERKLGCTCGASALTTDGTKSFPTEQRTRQKERKKAGHVAKKKPQVVEDHHDDCGEDFGPLGDDTLYAEGSENEEPSEDETCVHVTDLGMNGSEFVPETPQDHSQSSAMHFEDIASFNTWSASQKAGFHDVAELCGGAGGTGALLVRRGYKAGPNFDVVCGINLLMQNNRAQFLKYLDECRPMILIISTPCTGMKGFSALNRAINHSGWLRSRRVSVPLAKLAGIAAMAQMSAGRHFIAEHPQSSDLWQLPEWRFIAYQCSIATVIVHQCMAGLKGRRSGLPVFKPTEFWSSDPLLVHYLHGLL